MKYLHLFVTILVIGASMVGVLGTENGVPPENDDGGNIFTNAVSLENVFDWVFGNPDDEQFKHEVDEHFGYLTSGNDERSLADLAQLIGIKPDFLNFKAHDYDNNDKIDGLEMLSLIINERTDNFGQGHQHHSNNNQVHQQQQQHGQNHPNQDSPQFQQQKPPYQQSGQNPIQSQQQNQKSQNPLSSEQYLQLSSKIIDRLFQEEDSNNDGFLDFGEYSSARLKLGARK